MFPRLWPPSRVGRTHRDDRPHEGLVDDAKPSTTARRGAAAPGRSRAPLRARGRTGRVRALSPRPGGHDAGGLEEDDPRERVLGVDAAATWDIWRFLLEIDWVDRVAAFHLPLDHPLPFLVDRINKLRLSVWDALWLRLRGRAGRLPRPGRTRHPDGRRSTSSPTRTSTTTPMYGGERPGAPYAAPAGRPPGGRCARLRLPRRRLVRAARPGRARRGGRARRARAGRRGVSHRCGALASRSFDRRHRSERQCRRPRRSRAGAPRCAVPRADPDPGAPRRATESRSSPRRTPGPSRWQRRSTPATGCSWCRCTSRRTGASPSTDVHRRRGATGGADRPSLLRRCRAARHLPPRALAARRGDVAASGVPFTAVRNGMYADRIASWFDGGADHRARRDGRGQPLRHPGVGRGDRSASPIPRTTIDPVTITGAEALSLSEPRRPPRRSRATGIATSLSIAKNGSRTGARSGAPNGRSRQGSRITTAWHGVRPTWSPTTTGR